jgi:hypothetical protein
MGLRAHADNGVSPSGQLVSLMPQVHLRSVAARYWSRFGAGGGRLKFLWAEHLDFAEARSR